MCCCCRRGWAQARGTKQRQDRLSDALQHAHVKAARGRFIRAAQGAVASAGEVELKIHAELHNIELLLDELAMTPRTRGPAVSSGLEADSWVEQRLRSRMEQRPDPAAAMRGVRAVDVCVARVVRGRMAGGSSSTAIDVD